MRKKMRILSAVLLFAFSFEAAVNAQTIKPKPADKGQIINPKAEIVSSSEKVVKDAPFSADAVSESVQILFDGNRISQRTATRLYRDGAGRFRRDEMPKPVGIGSFVEMPAVIFILDPVANLKFYLYPESKTVRQSEFRDGKADRQKQLEKLQIEIERVEEQINDTKAELGKIEENYEKIRQKLESQKSADDEQEKKRIEQEISRFKQQIETRKLRLESMKERLKNQKWSVEPQKWEIQKPSKPVEKQITREAQSESSSTSSSSTSGSVTENDKPAKVATESKIFKKSTKLNLSKLAASSNEPNIPSLPVLPKGEVKNESLGTRRIEGVETEGVRLTTTVAAGAIGNERPLEITYERWFSKELELIVFSKYTDPRFGEQTYRLTNIKRSEPDSALFTPPSDYKIVNAPDKKIPTPRVTKPRVPTSPKKAASI